MKTALRVLVVEDYKDDRDIFAEILMERGCQVDVAADYLQAIAKLEAGTYDVVIIDLKIPDKSGVQNPEGGVELLMEIRSRNIRTGIVILTGQSQDLELLETLKKTERLGYSSFLVKDSIMGLRQPEEGAEQLYNEVLKASLQSMTVAEEVALVSAEDPFALTYSEYQRLDSSGVAALQRKAHEEKDEWADDSMKASGDKWLVVCGDDDSRRSADMQQLPTPEELEEIGKKHDRVPFLFIRMSDAEEVCRPVVGWRTHGSDRYPTVDIKIQGRGKTRVVEGADFDTGSPMVHLSLEDMLKRGLVTMNDIDVCRRKQLYYEARTHLGVDTPCYYHLLEISMSSGKQRILCELVERWNDSGFCVLNSKREALVGRVVLSRFKLRLVLDGKHDKSWFLPHDHPEP